MTEVGAIEADFPLFWYRYRPLGSEYYRVVGEPGPVTGVAVTGKYCMAGWALLMDRDVDRYGRESGVAFTRPPTRLLAESDIPGLDSIRAELGLLDRPTREQGGYEMGGYRYPMRSVIGLYRFDLAGDTTVVGVINSSGYEGSGAEVFEIAGGTARVVADFHMGGC